LLEYTEKPTLQYYLLISQEKMLVEVYARNGEKWEWAHYEKPEQKIDSSHFGGTLLLSEIYEGIVFQNNAPSA
jgi:Uma2 family endonuclease